MGGTQHARRWGLSAAEKRELWERWRRYPDDPPMQISHETISRSLFVQARGVLEKELVRHLRTAAGDLLAGSHNTHVATLVERRARFTLLVKVPRKDTQTVVRALGRPVRRLPAALRKSLTWDRGLELAAHQAFAIATTVLR